MKNAFHLLRTHRKKTLLTQSDIAFLLNLSDNSHISRCESGQRSPTIDIVLAYHLLFDSQLGDFFIDQREMIKRRIASRVQPLIKSIQKQPLDFKAKSRITYLKSLLTKLNQ